MFAWRIYRFEINKSLAFNSISTFSLYFRIEVRRISKESKFCLEKMSRSIGLIDKNNGANIPLESIKVRVNVTGFTAHVVATLNYSNKGVNPIEAIYIFPVDEQAAICGFQATIDGRTIVAEVREKQEARDTYDDAISCGYSAYLLEESDESSDIFRISVGNLPPKKSAAVEVKFVTELAVEKEGRVVFVLPTVLNPRYTPADTPASISTESSNIIRVDSLYSFDFEMHVRSASAITEIISSSNTLSVDINENEDGKTALVKLAEPHKADKDLEVQILSAEPFIPHALVEDGVAPSDEKSGEDSFLSQPVVMLNFFPEFPNVSSEIGEFIFVVDRSGSMSGDGILNARNTLLLFLKSLPDGCFFNVIGFGSSYEHLFNQSKKYNDKTVETACRLAKKMKANLGGTEILEPLQWVFRQPLVKGAPRQVFLLTDGAVGNTQQVIDLVRRNAAKARCFSFGIGFGASTALIKGVARAGRGTAEFVQSEDQLQAKVIKTLKHALQPLITDVEITWNLPNCQGFEQVPSLASPIVSGDRLVLFGLMNNDLEGDSHMQQCSVRLQGSIAYENKKEAIEHTVSFQLNKKLNESTGFMKELTLHRLAGKKLIQDKQDRLGDSVNNQEIEAIIKVSRSANVISNFTAFVAVDKESHEPIPCAMLRPAELLPRQQVQFYCGGIPPPGSLRGGGGPIPKRKKRSASDQAAVRNRIHGGGPVGFLGRMKKSSSKMLSVEALEEPLQGCQGAVATKTVTEFSLVDIVALQKASGAWEMTEELAQQCGSTLADLQHACPDTFSVAENVWATALALVVLASKFNDKVDEWEMVGKKAKKWLKRQFAGVAEYQNVIFAAAKAIGIADPDLLQLTD